MTTVYDACEDACHCDCPGCKLHFDEEPRIYSDSEAIRRLDLIACEVLGHKPEICIGKWVECNRCGAHISGPKPGLMDRMAYGAELALQDMGRHMNAMIVGIADPAIYD